MLAMLLPITLRLIWWFRRPDTAATSDLIMVGSSSRFRWFRFALS
jgi:hypothetical protein